MKKLILLFTLLPVLSFGQTTAIPDPNFEQVLISYGYDNVIDGSVLTANINTVSSLYIVNKNISSLQGVEDFIALTHLECSENQLTSLDVSNNTALTSLICQNNQLTSSDVSNNTALVLLRFAQNQLTSLDVSNNTALTSLICQHNQLTSLDVSNNTALTHLICHNNQLTCLNAANGNNMNILLIAQFNPNLTCIEVDDATWSTANWPGIDSQTSFSLDCNNDCSTSTIGINENTNNINLYPNPTNNLITLDIEGYNGSVNVELYDLQGRLLKTNTNTTISMQEYAKGIYVFKVAYGDIVEKLKVVKE